MLSLINNYKYLLFYKFSINLIPLDLGGQVCYKKSHLCWSDNVSYYFFELQLTESTKRAKALEQELNALSVCIIISIPNNVGVN